MVMKWPAALSAKLTRLWAFVSQGYGQRFQPTDGTNTCHSVPITKPKPSRAETPNLALRAHRLHNRNSDAAERYLRRHQTLAKGVLKYD